MHMRQGSAHLAPGLSSASFGLRAFLRQSELAGGEEHFHA